jgi:hypothetical protein
MNPTLRTGIVLALVVMGAFFSGCQLQNPNGLGNNSDSSLVNSPGLSGIFGGTTNGAGGSGPSGSLTPADTQALQNVVGQAQALNPPPGVDAAISQDLQNQINALMQQQAQGQDVSTAAIALLGALFQQCSQKVAALGPVPGQPLIGDWQEQGSGCGLAAYTVTGSGYPGSGMQIYNLTGGINPGQVAATPDGRWQLRSQIWNGQGIDAGFQGQNLSGTGTLTGQIASTTKYGTGYTPCNANVVLVNSRNPIPANYSLAIQTMGACYRKALALMRINSLFKNMNPALQQLLYQQMVK